MRVREKVGDLLAEEEGMPGAKRTTAHSVQPRAPSCGAAGPGSGLNTRHSTPTRSGTRPAPGPALAPWPVSRVTASQPYSAAPSRAVCLGRRLRFLICNTE